MGVLQVLKGSVRRNLRLSIRLALSHPTRAKVLKVLQVPFPLKFKR
jgi:hypothetical protein